jgi:hypothetical protein
MPRNVRNFWLEIDVDARAKTLGTGPIAKDGGFNLRILVRKDGAVSDSSVTIAGRAMPNGDLIISADCTDPTILVSDNNRSAILLTSKR